MAPTVEQATDRLAELGFECVSNDSDEVIAALLRAAEQVVTEDSLLLRHSAGEQAICHRLALYLELLLHETGINLPVDCEYNRVEEPGTKDRVKRLERDCPEVRGDNVAPDIIVHERGTSDNNRLVVEAKLLSTASDIKICADVCKLDHFVCDNDLHYQNAIFALFSDNEDDPDILFYRRRSPVAPRH